MFSKLAALFRSHKPTASTRPARRPTLQVESLDERVVPAVVTVSGQANIYAAGTPVVARPPSPGGGGGGVRPQEISLAALGDPVQLTFPTVTGAVSGWAARGGYNGADGGPSWGGRTLVPSHGGISGIRHDRATMFLVGVFLGPTGRPAKAPPPLDATRANTVATSAPALGQQFFIGDGKTAGGARQTVTVPAGATTLYLGFAEGLGFGQNRQPGFYGDNGGALKVDVRPAPAARQPSGRPWVGLFPDSRSFDDLSATFGPAAKRFVSALRAAGATVTLESGLRPAERAYLMHWSWMIAREGYDPRKVPPMDGVNIRWDHQGVGGQFDATASSAAAEAMVRGYGIVYKPSLQSRHTDGRAVDLSIRWTGTLNVLDASGRRVTIESGPKNGTNPLLWTVGATYGVKKLASDAPHWSDDGR